MPSLTLSLKRRRSSLYFSPQISPRTFVMPPTAGDLDTMHLPRSKLLPISILIIVTTPCQQGDYYDKCRANTVLHCPFLLWCRRTPLLTSHKPSYTLGHIWTFLEVLRYCFSPLSIRYHIGQRPQHQLLASSYLQYILSSTLPSQPQIQRLNKKFVAAKP